MLITIDKRGSINLPLAIRKALSLGQGSCLDLSVEEGGKITLHPVAIYRTVRLGERGLAKLKEARESGRGELPQWVRKDMQDARTDSDE
ncbi:MAG TPA: AbrB/MazE/SpoVT family DNA-binding domain-containing protein [Syntrophales bacterium]|nr:AbrB/MazE/SpoVT family DNA-binding domain-containing protein [Syntrophales bacterium]